MLAHQAGNWGRGFVGRLPLHCSKLEGISQ
nr:MAG TPA: hypothetical protein [Caudoviricetes sp.]